MLDENYCHLIYLQNETNPHIYERRLVYSAKEVFVIFVVVWRLFISVCDTTNDNENHIAEHKVSLFHMQKSH